ncbi:uncharacterized protein N7479_000269 [Penicillium vulpinum]|uniref:BTB domain-containing protein n=1 Tax=Penicillium vulpinum TaxID=29845 RepID=A0A1V6RNV4_9EURO|nr:uncharacterized protein N7479_000269 [Penicillium vulpinum]KAJ5970351.1 hypothetical protein N7479_000269 [Penicillium vulpinum]OQE03093.1 hypothetical protein PENVUL_c035G01120 [Penicillium vulpinum]
MNPAKTPGHQNWPFGQIDLQEHNDKSSIRVISANGDLILEYIAPDDSSSSPTRCKWRVASDCLTSHSPYFQALLDPAKFSEGRQFSAQKQAWNETQIPDSTSQHELPTVRLPDVHSTNRCGEDAIELFLKILCLDSFDQTERAVFENELKTQSSSLVARMIDLADSLNSPRVVQDILHRIGYLYGKSKPTLLARFNTALLSMKEDRIRQIIFISTFLNDSKLTRIMTHALLVVGSRSWINGLDCPEEERLRWRLPNGLEEEIYYRRQCVLNTITDLQAYFLRVYGGMEETDTAKPAANNRTLGAAFTASAHTLLQSRQFQCRGGFNNSSQCDLFQLGQMIRFFSMRARTIFLGSTLIDPDFDSLPNEDGHATGESRNDQPPGPPSDITAIIASIKQYPDYTIDEAHTGCGVRRRIMPSLECIEKFVCDDRGLLGITPAVLDTAVSDPSRPSKWTLWADFMRKKHSVDISFARVTAVYYPSAPSKNQVTRSTPQEELARLLFTAARRDWSAAGSG